MDSYATSNIFQIDGLQNFLRCGAPLARLRHSWSGAPLKQTGKNTTLQMFFILCTWPVSPPGITLLPPIMLLTSTAKKKNYSRTVCVSQRFFAWNCGLYWSVERCNVCAKSRFWFVCRTHAKNSLLTKLTSQTWIWLSYFFNAKTYSTARAECMCELVKKKTAEWNFSNIKLSIFLI